MAFQVLRNQPSAHLLMDVQLINQPDGFGFFFVNMKFAVDKIVAIRGKAAISMEVLSSRISKRISGFASRTMPQVLII